MLITVGHKAVRDAIQKDKPRTAFVVGPDSIGKTTLVKEILSERFEYVLTVNERDIEQACLDKSYTGAPLGVIAKIERWDTYVVAVLAHYAEQMDKDSALVIVSESLPNYWTAITDRLYRCKVLTPSEVKQILMEKKLVQEKFVDFAASTSGGQVKQAIATGRGETIYGTVKSILKAVHDGDQDLLTNSIAGLYNFSPVIKWWTEAKTRVWSVYSPEGSYGLHEDSELMDEVFRAIRSRKSPQLAAHAAFWKACEKRAGRA